MLKDILRAEGFIPRVLMERPATYKMLKMVYTRSGTTDIDNYFQDSPSGQALRDRLKAVIYYGSDIIPKIIARNGSIKIAHPDKFISIVDKEIHKLNQWPLICEMREKGFYGATAGHLDSTLNPCIIIFRS